MAMGIGRTELVIQQGLSLRAITGFMEGKRGFSGKEAITLGTKQSQELLSSSLIFKGVSSSEGNAMYLGKRSRTSLGLVSSNSQIKQ